MAVFVEYFESFSSELMSREEIIERLKLEKKYTEKSCISRTRHARSIIQAGLGSTALQKVIGSDSQNVSELTRAKAQHLLVSA
jgi:hypothetical protein